MRTRIILAIAILAVPVALAAEEAPPADPAPEPTAEVATAEVATAEVATAEVATAEVATAGEIQEAVDGAVAQVRKDTEKAMTVFEESAHAFGTVMDSAFRMAQALEQSLKSDEYKQFTDKLQMELEEAARPMKEIDWQGLAYSTEEMAQEDWEAIEAMTYQFFKHLAETLEGAETNQPAAKEEPAPVPPDAI